VCVVRRRRVEPGGALSATRRSDISAPF
jgi:hypothetical protein